MSKVGCFACVATPGWHKLETKLADFFEPRLEPVTVLPCPFENPNIVGGTLFRVQFSNSRLAGLVSTPGPVSQSPGTLAVDQP
jgi:hypothetical protein